MEINKCKDCGKKTETWVYVGDKEEYLCHLCWAKRGKEQALNQLI